MRCSTAFVSGIIDKRNLVELHKVAKDLNAQLTSVSTTGNVVAVLIVGCRDLDLTERAG
jgi:hypothetical protein